MPRGHGHPGRVFVASRSQSVSVPVGLWGGGLKDVGAGVWKVGKGQCAPWLSLVCPGLATCGRRVGERTTMISAERGRADSGCSPYWAVGGARGWVHSTGVNSVERPATDVPYQTLTCQNGVLAGQRLSPGNFDTEEVTGSIPVSPTSVCAAQRLVTKSSVTSRSHVAPYGGSKMGAQDHLARWPSLAHWPRWRTHALAPAQRGAGLRMQLKELGDLGDGLLVRQHVLNLVLLTGLHHHRHLDRPLPVRVDHPELPQHRHALGQFQGDELLHRC